jgi:hypothetical protein
MYNLLKIVKLIEFEGKFYWNKQPVWALNY